MDLALIRTMFIKEHDIEFKSFSCNNPTSNNTQLFSHVDPVEVNYGISNDDQWNDSNNKFNYTNPCLIIQHKGWHGCICNPPNFGHVCSAKYISKNGWNLIKVMTAARHHYMWMLLSIFFSKQKWSGEFNDANFNDLRMNQVIFNNQLGEAAYISNLLISYSPKEELIVKYYSYT